MRRVLVWMLILMVPTALTWSLPRANTAIRPVLAITAGTVRGSGTPPRPAGAVPRAAPVLAMQVYELVMTPKPPGLTSRSAILLDLDAGKVLLEKDAHRRYAPASLTKVVTALVALDRMRLEQLVAVRSSINQLPWDSTRMGLRVGERVSVLELLNGLFLNSGNDAAITLSEAVMPRADFIALMNAKAASLEMADTHFVNPIGLDDPGQVSSAADLARAAQELVARYPEVAALAARAPCLCAVQPQSTGPHVPGRDRAQDRLDRPRRWLPDRHRDPRRPPPDGGPPGVLAGLQ
jgi:D-alanyl-D-alanine carboxypeptidase